MTRDEIKLVAFILIALVVGASVRYFRERNYEPRTPIPPAKSHGWSKPPYIFKDAKDARAAREAVR